MPSTRVVVVVVVLVVVAAAMALVGEKNTEDGEGKEEGASFIAVELTSCF